MLSISLVSSFVNPPVSSAYPMHVPTVLSTYVLHYAMHQMEKVGFYSDPAKGWVEGVAILCAVLIVAVVTATNDYSKDKQFRALNAVKDDVTVQASPTRNPSVHGVSDCLESPCTWG